MKKYIEILLDIEHKIEQGQLGPGQKLPSVRNAAKHYGCSISTITRAYTELEKRHAIYAIAQSGYYVVEKKLVPFDPQKSQTIDFSSASPDPSVFPYSDFQHCVNKALDLYKCELFTCGYWQGLTKLRHTLVSHLVDYQVFTKTEQIVVTSGVQQALEILASIPFPNGNTKILVEQPSYNLYLQFLEEEIIPVDGITRTNEGIDLGELEQKFKHGGIKFFYTMSRHHNPLGISYRNDERQEIARLASKYDVYVVEDDYMVDLGEERSFYPIHYYDVTSHVIYLKSFSKIIFPGLRVGAAVLPPQLLPAFETHRRSADTSQLSQAALEVYLGNGMYERHKRKIAREYAARISLLNSAVDQFNDRQLIKLSDVQSGVYVQMKLPQTVNLEQLVKRLADQDILVVSGKQFYLSGYLEREKFLRLGISRVQPAQIEEGVRRILEEVKREAKSIV